MPSKNQNGSTGGAFVSYQLIEFPKGDFNNFYYGQQIRMAIMHVLSSDIPIC
jgi:hypothetical protein